MTTEQKVAYGKQFSKKEREAYQKGKNIGFKQGVHAPRGSRFTMTTEKSARY